MLRYNTLLFVGIYFFLCFTMAQDLKVYFLAEEKEQKTFWNFDIRGNFPQEQGIINIHILFNNQALPDSHRRLYMRNYRFEYVYGEVKGKVLSGEYTLKINYINKNTRKVFHYNFFVGSLYSQRMESIRYKDSIKFFVEEIKLLLQNIERDIVTKNIDNYRNNIKNYYKTYFKISKKIESLSVPNVLFPHFCTSMYHCHKINQYTKTILEDYKNHCVANKNITVFSSRYQKYQSKILNLTQKIISEITFKEVDEKIIKEDILCCQRLTNNMKYLLDEESKKNKKKLDEMVKYFLLEVESWHSKVEHYQKSVFIQNHPEIWKPLKRIPTQIYDLLCAYVDEVYTQKNYELPEEIRKQQVSITKIHNQIDKNCKQIIEHLDNYKTEQQKQIEDLYLSLYKEYSVIKKIALDKKKTINSNQIIILREKVKNIPDFNFRLWYMDALNYLLLLNNVKSKEDDMSNLYRLKYKTSLEILEEKLGYHNKKTE